MEPLTFYNVPGLDPLLWELVLDLEDTCILVSKDLEVTCGDGKVAFDRSHQFCAHIGAPSDEFYRQATVTAVHLSLIPAAAQLAQGVVLPAPDPCSTGRPRPPSLLALPLPSLNSFPTQKMR